MLGLGISSRPDAMQTHARAICELAVEAGLLEGTVILGASIFRQEKLAIRTVDRLYPKAGCQQTLRQCPGAPSCRENFSAAEKSVIRRPNF